MHAIKNGAIKIPGIDAKDIYIANHYIAGNPQGYKLKNKNGEYNLSRFKNVCDNSLDLPKLKQIYKKKYRNNGFSFVSGKHEYTYQVINVTFKYSNKEFNQVRRNVYVKFGYEYNNLEFSNCICLDTNGELIGVITNEETDKPVNISALSDYFDYENGKYICKKMPMVLNTRSELREILYSDGFICNGIKYVRWKRTSGSARVGKCLFINEALYSQIHKWDMCGLRVNEGQEIDLAALESYISLATSSIVATIDIKPNEILLIDDYESVFREDVIGISSKDGRFVAEEKNIEIKNSIWDGQCLLDESLFEQFPGRAMLLLRNRFFKSCGFKTHIAKWFADNGITDVSQLNGTTYATKLSDIKLITSPSSIKYLKFGSFRQWLDNIESTFGVVKYDKKTHYFDGRLVQTHYQLLNTLQMTKNEMESFLKPSLDFAQQLRDNPAVVRYYIKYPDEMNVDCLSMMSKNDVVYGLMSVNDSFTKTKYYRDFLHDLLRAYYKNLKCGHVLVNGNYSTLFGNPIEMLKQSIGKFNGESQIGKGNIHSKRFEYNKTVLGSRSPHVCCSNILLANNAENKDIDKYFDLTDEIVCVNSIGESLLDRLSGCDFDSDTMLLTDNPTLIEVAKRNYGKFKVPVSLISAKKTKRYYTANQKADLDVKTSVNSIGEIINFSQVLNSLYWDNINHGQTHEENIDLYHDICILDIASGVEIDSAKKEFDINNVKELKRLKAKYADILNLDEKKCLPYFFSHISRQKGYYNPVKKKYVKHETSMDYLQTVINGFRIKNPYKTDFLPFVSILNDDKYASWHVNEAQIEYIFGRCETYLSNLESIYAATGRSGAESYALAELNSESFIADINKLNIGFSTMFSILSRLEHAENVRIKKVLMHVLFLAKNKCFFSAILKSKQEMEWIEQGGNDLKLFDIGFKIYKK